MYSKLSYKISDEVINNYNYLPKSVSNTSIFTMMRTYSRNILEGDKIIGVENFNQIITRVVNGIMSILKDRLDELNKEINLDEIASKFYDLIYNFKITPPGRGFWAMGTKLVHENKTALSLVNCTFITSRDIIKTKSEFFAYIMDCLMLGVGVGFDDKGADLLEIYKPGTKKYTGSFEFKDKIKEQIELINKDEYSKQMLKEELNFIDECNGVFEVYTIQDSRTGWVNALRKLLDSYFYPDKNNVVFEISEIRQKGIPLKTFGGTSSGPIPLIKGLSQIRTLIREKNLLDTELICDIGNIIATIVIAGNVRRSSQIFLSCNDKMIQIKDYSNPRYQRRMRWGWSSNNSLYVDNVDELENKLEKMKDTIIKQGEPGLFNSDLTKHYGRIIDGKTDCDLKSDGTNPCGEITLEGTHETADNTPYNAGGETCNLSECHASNYDFPTKQQAINEINNDLYYGVLYCKIVTLIEPHWQGTKLIQERNRRIGVSQTGIRTFLSRYNISIEEYKDILDKWYKSVKKYDEEISDLLQINKSIKVTTIKPSGTVTICGGGFASGMHAVPAKYFIRNIRISKDKLDMINMLKSKGFKIEDCVLQPDETSVVSFPCKSKFNELTKSGLSIEDQFELLDVLQTYWSDNQVSCTITFTEKEGDKIIPLLLKYKHSIKSVSLLKLNTDFYQQAPEITINESEYKLLIANIKQLDYNDFINYKYKEVETDNYCSGDKCIKK